MRKSTTQIKRMPRIYNTQTKPKRSWAGFFGFLRDSCILIVVIAALYFFFAGSFFKLKTVAVEGTLLGDEASVRNIAPIGTNIFFLDKVKLSKMVMQNPLYEEVEVYKGLPDGLKIVVKERKALLLWQSGDKVYCLDKEGVAFLDYPVASFPGSDSTAGQELANIPKVIDTKSIMVQSGRWVTSASFMQFIADTQNQLALIFPEFATQKVEVMDTTYDVTFVSKDGMRVVFNTLGNPDVQVRNLLRMWQQKKITNQSTVDLRINRWAYVS